MPAMRAPLGGGPTDKTTRSQHGVRSSQEDSEDDGSRGAIRRPGFLLVGKRVTAYARHHIASGGHPQHSAVNEGVSGGLLDISVLSVFDLCL